MTRSARLRRHAPRPADQYRVLVDSVIAAAEQSFFSYAEPGNEAPDGDGRPWIAASVAFAGAFAGSLEMIVREPTGHDLFCALAGEERGEGLAREQVFDAFGEFANIVCGDWLTRVCERRRFDLYPPDVRVLDDHGRHSWWNHGAAVPILEMRINDEPLRLRLRLYGEE